MTFSPRESHRDVTDQVIRPPLSTLESGSEEQLSDYYSLTAKLSQEEYKLAERGVGVTRGRRIAGSQLLTLTWSLI